VQRYAPHRQKNILEYANFREENFQPYLATVRRLTEFHPDRYAATANCRTGKKEELTTGWRDDLVEQLHVRPLPYLLYDRTQFFVRLVDISCRWQHDENDRKKNVCTLDIAPLRSESSAQKRSGMNWHLFSRDLTVLPAHPHVQSAIGMSHTCLCLSWYSSTDSGGMEGWVGRMGADRRRTDTVGCRGGCNSAVTVRFRSALKKFREYLPILAG